MTFPNTGPHRGAGSGQWSGTADHPDQKPSRRRSYCLGCLVLPLVGVVVLSVYATVQSFQSGRIVPFPELSASPEWTAEGLPGRSVGGWWSEERIVQVSEEGLTAVATDGGEQLWRLEPDTRVCGLAEEPAEGVGVVLLDGDHEDPDPPSLEEEDPARSCDDVLAVDLDDGSELWRSGPLLESGLPESRHREELDVSVHEDGAVVRVENELLGLDLADGSRSWGQPATVAAL
ncbi:PQQ-binding-like beta-propeller repeat protein [Nocardiopsis xinjiangensis]|uniref:PQQ-binding-like beta-propeller repeat protein n=1 Tax=Nocardiopsis xinjiangensis TaxID=124285 RepID=UPI00034A9C55|nr:PQQ-binding-like beta-propeller repeat protein [Nocardiopsis xinjiangensis]